MSKLLTPKKDVLKVILKLLDRMKGVLTLKKWVLTARPKLLTHLEGLLKPPALLLQKIDRPLTFAENGYFFYLIKCIFSCCIEIRN